MRIRTQTDLPVEEEVEEIKEIKEPEPVEVEVEDELTKYVIPPKKMFNVDLKKLKSFKQIRQKYKKKNMEFVFVNDLKVILDEYSPIKEFEFCDELLVQIMNIAEEYFIQKNEKEREESKLLSINKLMLPYYRLLRVHGLDTTAEQWVALNSSS